MFSFGHREHRDYTEFHRGFEGLERCGTALINHLAHVGSCVARTMAYRTKPHPMPDKSNHQAPWHAPRAAQNVKNRPRIGDPRALPALTRALDDFDETQWGAIISEDAEQALRELKTS
jgi:hypothetical protein